MAYALACAALTSSLLTGCKAAGDPDDAPKEAVHPVVEVRTACATEQPVEQVLHLRGTLGAADGCLASLAPVSTGRLLEVTVQVGDHVVKGQGLARIDNRPDREQASAALAALEVARAEARTSLVQAEALARTAELGVQKNQRGARLQEVRAAEQAVVRDRAACERAASEQARVEFLVEQGTMARRQLEDAQMNLCQARAAQIASEQQLSLVREGLRHEDKVATRVAAQAAHQGLEQARRGAQARVAQAAAAVRASAALVRQGEVNAPFEGQVIKRWLQPGDVAGPTTPVLQVADVRTLVLTAALPAHQARGLRPGLLGRMLATGASSSAQSLKTQPPELRVLALGQADPQTGLVEVRVRVSNPGQALRLGEPVSADIVLEHRPHAVVVPTSAVFARDGHLMVLRKGDDGIVHEQVVVTGVEQAGKTEIRQGLQAGTRVVVQGAYELEEGATVREAGASPLPKESPQQASPAAVTSLPSPSQVRQEPSQVRPGAPVVLESTSTPSPEGRP